MLDTLQGHKVQIDIFDEDSINADDYLGTVFIATDDLLADDVNELTLGLESTDETVKGKGRLKVDLNYLPIHQSLDERCHYFIIDIFVYSFSNVMNSDLTYPNTKVEVQVEGEATQTSGLISQEPHPHFLQSFLFLFDKTDQDKEINIRLLKMEEVEGESKSSPMGYVRLYLKELMRKGPIFHHIEPLREAVKPYMTATISAKVTFC